VFAAGIYYKPSHRNIVTCPLCIRSDTRVGYFVARSSFRVEIVLPPVSYLEGYSNVGVAQRTYKISTIDIVRNIPEK